MRLKQLTEHVYYTESDSFSDRPALGYILGRDFSVMVDAGNSPKHVLAYRQALEERGFAPPKFCVITHWLWYERPGMGNHCLPGDRPGTSADGGVGMERPGHEETVGVGGGDRLC